VALDFTPGSTFLFSTSYLEGITDLVRNASAIQRATFPRKWASQAPPLAPYGQSPQAGTPPTQWPTPAAAPQPAASGEKLGGQHQVREDIHHPKIRSMMDPYLRKFNNFVSLSDILTSPGKQMSDLPTIPKYCHPMGQSFLCWNSVLGKCFRGARCKFSKGYVSKGESMDDFANAIIECIGKGVVYYTNIPATQGSPDSKRKVGGGGGAATS
jgi:hypothetical protein